jgi:hypothetical protein
MGIDGMDLNEIVKNLTSGDIPTGTLGGLGLAALVIAWKTARFLFKFFLILIGLALLASAVWWHLHYRH